MNYTERVTIILRAFMGQVFQSIQSQGMVVGIPA